MDTFHDQVVILTGASSGIGKQMALQLARQGARLALAARRPEKLHAVAGECRALGGEALVVPTDVSEEAQCRALVEATLERWGRLDMLINNAGVMMWAAFEDIDSPEVAERVMKINYLGAVYCTHHALKHLKRREGRIVAISSLAGKTGVPTRSLYAASKHAMTGFFDSLRIELREAGVSVTTIYPGFVAIEDRGRALGPDGASLGASPVREDRAMSAEECARLSLEAAAARRRDLIMTPTGKLGLILKTFAPGLVDLLAIRTLQRYRRG